MSVAQPSPTAGDPLAATIKETAAAGLAAAIAGVLAGGIGGRIAMRVSAILNPLARGARSENGNRVGDITLDGTLGLVIFGGLLTGVVVAGVWVAVRDWLPRKRGWRELTAAVTALGVVGFLVIDAGNIDFFILNPPWTHVAMFGGIVALAGVLTAWFDRRLVPFLRDSWRFGPFAVFIVAMGVLLAVPGLGAFFSSEFCGCEPPPRVTGLMIVAAFVATATERGRLIQGRTASRRIQLVGMAATAAAVVTGYVHLAGQVSGIV